MLKQKQISSPLAMLAFAGIAAALFVALVPGVSQKLFGPTYFMPHRTCYLDDPNLIRLHVISDSLIGLAYFSISLTLVYLVQKANVPFHLAFIAFGVFIGACGATHFMEVWTIWEPHYWLAGIVKAVTAVASVATAIWLYPLLPQ